MKKLYIGNLAYETTEDELKEAFSEYGEVESVSLITDKATGRSKGFAFVEMDDEGAEDAKKELNQTELGGRTIKVDDAKPRK